MQYPIGIFDSGVGGLTVLDEIRNLLPEEDFIYYADSKNCPYGDKTEEQLLEICSRIVEFLIEKKCKLIVIACNTATTSCLKKLREKYPNTIFVGVVPAIKVAYDHGSKNTLLMATPYTIKSPRVKELLTDFHAKNQKITLLSCENLASAIENGDEKEVEEILNHLLLPYREECFDTIVLGCTHYPIIKQKIKKYFPTASFVDGSIGVAKEVKRQLEQHHLESEKKSQGVITFYHTKDEKNENYYFDLLKQIRENK